MPSTVPMRIAVAYDAPKHDSHSLTAKVIDTWHQTNPLSKWYSYERAFKRLLNNTAGELSREDREILGSIGFANCPTYIEEHNLIKVYQTLSAYYDQDFSSIYLAKQASIDTLDAYVFYFAINYLQESLTPAGPPENAYVQWLVRTRYSAQYGDGMNHEPRMLLWFQQSWQDLRQEGQFTNINAIEPAEKRLCFIFYTLISHWSREGIQPLWEHDIWQAFGFCVAGLNEDYQRQILRLYTRLLCGDNFHRDVRESCNCSDFDELPTVHCEFEEFWIAFKNGTLVDLLDKFDLADDRNQIPDLTDFLNQSDLRQLLIWRFVEFLTFDDKKHKKVPYLEEHTEAPLQQATDEYGFYMSTLCFIPEQRRHIELKQFYRQLLRLSSARELHDAQEAHHLLQLARRYMGVLPSEFARTLKHIDDGEPWEHEQQSRISQLKQRLMTKDDHYQLRDHENQSLLSKIKSKVMPEIALRERFTTNRGSVGL